MNVRRLPSLQLPSLNKGLSLVELMVALALGLLILTALTMVFVNTSGARKEIENTGRQIENGRFAGELITDDLRLAGYFGEINLVSAAPAVAAPAALPDPCDTNTANWPTALYIHAQGYRAPDAATAPDMSGTSCSTWLTSANLKPGSDIVVVRRVRTCAAGTTGCDATADRGYLQVSMCATETPTTSYKFGADGTIFDRTQKDCATAAVRRQYYVNIYFVAPCSVGTGTNDVCQSGDDSIPTLKRLEMGNVSSGTFTIVPLVEGIEQLKIDYGIDTTSADGLPDVYGDPSAYPDAASCDDACKVANWQNVMTARLYVLARNIDPSPRYTDSKTYNLGSVAFGPFTDSYRRHVYTTLVRLMNPAGKRDVP